MNRTGSPVSHDRAGIMNMVGAQRDEEPGPARPAAGGDDEEAPRASKSARTRQRILDAAAAVFREQGYAHARLSDIATSAGIQTGSIYYHFESREHLVSELLRLGVTVAWEQVRTALDALPPDAGPVDRLATAVRAHTLAVLEISDYASAHARIVGQVPADVRDRSALEQQRYGDYWSVLFDDARRAGLLRGGDDLFVSRMLMFGAMNWTAEWYRPNRHAAPAAVAEQAVRVLLAGILAPGVALPEPATPGGGPGQR